MKNNFCVISHNCWGAEIYRELKLPYNTPFVGLFIPSTCYVKLLGDIDFWLMHSISFVSTSKYELYNEFSKNRNDFYPIGLLGNEVEIHFMHYSNEDEAKDKWTRRLARMPQNKDIWFVEFSNREIFNNNEITIFDQLSFKNKIFLSHKNIEGINSLVHIKEFENADELIDGKALYGISTYYFNPINWVYGQKISVSFLKKIKLLLRNCKRMIGL